MEGILSDFCSTVVASTSSPTPAHYHVVYQGCGETRMSWHGETYCLVGGYRTYGDAPLATPAKKEAEKPVPRQAPKRHLRVTESDEKDGCPSPKIPRLQCGGRRLTRKKLAG
uniref:DPEP2 neighbor n=1 Tax=Suricata suricatta TaxID=37032 RepID=A0A673UKM8_SURSU